jgi:hypothetical protein
VPGFNRKLTRAHELDGERPRSHRLRDRACPGQTRPLGSQKTFRCSLAYSDAVRRKVIVVVAVSLLYVGVVVVLRRRGYSIGGNTVVRCREGHLYTTLWIPGASLKAVRLGWWRLQRCPVGKHWSLITPVKESDLTEEERRLAAQSRDVRIP